MCDSELSYLGVFIFISLVYTLFVITWDFIYHRRVENEYLSSFKSVSPFFTIFFLIFDAMIFYLYITAYNNECDLGMLNAAAVAAIVVNTIGAVASCFLYDTVGVNAAGFAVCEACCV